MGDHRISVKCEVEMHGLKDSCDMWLNHSPREVENVDHRIIEFFQNFVHKAMHKYHEELYESQREERERGEREQELATLARLKDKYERKK